MEKFTSAAEESGDLFGSLPPARSRSVSRGRRSQELSTASALCRQLRRQRTIRDKQRIAHLICLNLLSMLVHRS